MNVDVIEKMVRRCFGASRLAQLGWELAEPDGIVLLKSDSLGKFRSVRFYNPEADHAYGFDVPVDIEPQQFVGLLRHVMCQMFETSMSVELDKEPDTE